MIEKTLKISLFLILLIYAVNFIGLGFLIGPFDYDHLSAYYELAWRFWTQSPGVPQFNPFLCGGRTLGGDPQIPIFHPIVILVPILGPTWTMKVELMAQLMIGCWGLNRWLFNLHLNKESRLWGLFLFLTGGGVVAKCMVGHVTLGFYFLLPLLFYFNDSLSASKVANKSTLIAYWLLFTYCGLYKPNFLIYLVPVLLIETSCRSLLSQSFRPLFHLCLAVLISSICNAVSELPAFFYFKSFPDRFDTLPGYYTPLYTLLFNLVMPLKTIPKLFYGPGHFLQRHEYNFFLGPVPLYLALLGMKQLKNKNPKLLSLLVFMGVCFALGLGSVNDHFSFWYLFTWLKPFWPGFNSIRVPPRFWFGGFLVLIVFSSIGFTRITQTRAPRLFIIFGILPLMLTATVNLFKVSALANQTQWTTSRSYPPDWEHAWGDQTAMYSLIRQGKGVIKCLPNMAVYESPDLSEGNSLKYKAPNEAITSLRWLSWNRIQVQAIHTHKTPFTLAINLNSSPFWHFKGEGKVVYHPRELLTLKTESGTIEGELFFEQPWIREAIFLSLCGWLFLIAFSFFSFKGKLE